MYRKGSLWELERIAVSGNFELKIHAYSQVQAARRNLDRDTGKALSWQLEGIALGGTDDLKSKIVVNCKPCVSCLAVGSAGAVYGRSSGVAEIYRGHL